MALGLHGVAASQGSPPLLAMGRVVVDEVQSQYGVRTLSTAIGCMEKNSHHTFCIALRAAFEERPVLLAEGLFDPKAIRAHMTQIVFETSVCQPCQWPSRLSCFSTPSDTPPVSTGIQEFGQGIVND